MDPGRWKCGSGQGGTQCGQFGRGALDTGDEKVRCRKVVGQNGRQQERRALGEEEWAVGMHQTQDMIRKEPLECEGAEDPRGGRASSGHGRYASGVKVVFADKWALLGDLLRTIFPSGGILSRYLFISSN